MPEKKLTDILANVSIEHIFLNETALDKQANGQTGKQADGQAGKQADRQTGKWADGQAGKQADRQTGRRADGQAGRQADRQTGKWADGQAGRQASGQTGRRADGQAGRQASGQTGKRADRQAGRQASGQTGKRADRQAGRQASGQTGKRADRQAGRRADRQAGKQAGKQAGRRADQQIRRHLGNLTICHITCDSRKVTPGSLFVAISGHKFNGHDFIKEACQNASALVLESRFFNTLCIPKTFCGPVIWVKNTRSALSQMAFCFFAHPALKKVQLIGVTGTNGKTTSIYILETLLKALGQKVGVLSTIDHHIDKQTWPSKLTTPDPLTLHHRIFQMCEKYITSLVMEVSSHALCQHRVDCMKFSAALWTNLTQDHLDYHHSMENYFKAKKRLFSQDFIKNNGILVINRDDLWGQRLIKESSGNIITYGYHNQADLQVLKSLSTLQGLQIDLLYKKTQYQVSLQLIGQYNTSNVVGCLALLIGIGYHIEDILKIACQIKGVPGRLELVTKQSFYGFVDYAHTSDALEQTLKSLHQIKPYSSSQIITVFGCGGGRDKTKRPLMAQVAQKYSDIVIITSDNPRYEDPQAILKQIKSGFTEAKQVFEISDRKEAILKGVSLAKKNDILLIAGKGHEEYQTFQTERIAFSDRKILQQATTNQKFQNLL